MNASSSINIDSTAERLVRQFDFERHHLMELIDELRPGAEDVPRWSPVNRSVLMTEARRSLTKLDELVLRLRTLQQAAEPGLRERLDATLFAAEISVDTAGAAVEQLREARIDWRPEVPPAPWTH